jgi:hypothetical protein
MHRDAIWFEKVIFCPAVGKKSVGICMMGKVVISLNKYNNRVIFYINNAL